MKKTKKFRAPAFVLAAIMSFACAVGFAERTASAAANSLGVDFAYKLLSATPNLGSNNDSPILTNLYPMVENALFFWSMNPANVQPNDVTRLRYNIDDGVQVELIVKKESSDAADVRLRLMRFGAGTYDTVINYDTFDIYKNLGNSAEANYIDKATYFANAYNPGLPAYDVLTDGKTSANGYKNLAPHFKIKEGYGFSFRYGGREYHFLWNSDDGGRFYFMTHMPAGRIYDASLDYAANVSTANVNNIVYTSTTTKRVCTGIAHDTMRVFPFSNGAAITSTEPVTADTPAGGQTKFDIDTDLAGHVRSLQRGANGTDAPPGSPDNKLCVRFDRPQEYVNHQFVTVSNAKPIKMQVFLDYSGNSYDTQVIVSDVTIDAPTISLGLSNGVSLASQPFVAGGDRLQLWLENMRPSILYERVTFSLSIADGSILFDDTTLSKGHTFTFLNYDIVVNNGQNFARIKPYVNVKGSYALYVGGARTAVINHDGATDDIYLPAASGNNVYQIWFSPDKPFDDSPGYKGYVYSQLLEYTIDESQLEVSPPNNFRIVDEEGLLIPIPNYDGKAAYAEFSAEWDIGSQTTIEALLDAAPGNTLTIAYDIYSFLTPDIAKISPMPAPFDTITAELSKDAGGVVSAVYSGGKVKDSPTNAVQLQAVPAQGNVLRYVYKLRVPFRTLAVKSGASISWPVPGQLEGAMVFPNIYFFGAKITSPVVSDMSIIDSMTLSDLANLLLPPPQDLTLNKTGAMTFTSRFSLAGDAIMNFIQLNTPYDANILQANLYLCQNESKLKNPPQNFDALDVVEVDTAGERRFDFSAYDEGVTPILVDEVELRDLLRQGKIIKLTGIALQPGEISSVFNDRTNPTINLEFNGMDENQKYFAMSELVLTQQSGGLNDNIFTSETTKIAGVTTEGEIEYPGANEEYPPAPILSVGEVANNSAEILWDDILGGTVEYEIIRLRGEQMNPAMLNSHSPLEIFFESLPITDKAAWRTDGEGASTILKLVNGALSPAEPTEALFESEMGSRRLVFTDYTLTPNNIYFYYARSVRVTPDGETVSLWARVSVTSKPVAGPRNLRADQLAQYDHKTEIGFIFDAHIMDMALIGVNYNLQYQLKRDGDDWREAILMDAALLVESALPIDSGLTRFAYKLSDLEPGTLYYVRVRAIDQNGDASLYTNVLQMRTDIDQSAYDEKHTVDEWVDYIKNAIKDLIKKPFWTIRDKHGEYAVVYRPDMFEGLAREGTAPILLAESPGATCMYYLPAQAITTANNWGKGFSIPHKGINIIISPNAFDMNMNDALMSAQNQLKLGKIKDYYIKITTRYRDLEKGAAAINVQIEVVGSRDDIGKWNRTMLEQMERHIADATSSNELSFINAQVARGIIPEVIVRKMDKKMAMIAKEMDSIAASRFERALKYRFAINNLDAPMLIIARDRNPLTAINAWRQERDGPRARDAMDFGGDKAIAEMRPGGYIFNGETVEIAGMEGQQLAGSFNAIGAKYYLQDFFGNGWEYNVDAPVSRFALAGTIARVAGAPRYAEPFNWLASHMDLSLSSFNAGSESTVEELRRCITALYLYKTNTSSMPQQLFASYQRVDIAALHKALQDLDYQIGL
ncbi:MAG: fibronectin type III domain-containing protein [Clostridiales bacterium]|jgi:hypothetical protein|nr:fibronectin type III domain-containing protein [Clostridiales bacterium]